MLNNPFYVGKVRHGEDVYDGLHDKLIDQDVWDQVQALRAKRSRPEAKGRKAHRVYLLARLARCHECDLKLVAQVSGRRGRRGRPIPYYYCPSYRRSWDCSTGGRYVQTTLIDKQVAALVKRLQLPDDWRERLEELADHREERENVEGKRRYIEGKLRRLREL